jgi:hypothetical protein
VGAVEPCDAPVAAAWTDAGTGEAFEEANDPMKPALEPGGVALVGTQLWWVAPGFADDGVAELTTLVGTDLETGDALDGSFADHPTGLSQGDLDGDGVNELVVSGGVPTLRWGDGATDLLPMGEGNHFVRDAALADLDGDGDVDIVLGYSSPTQAPDEARPDILWNQGERTFSGPTPIEGADERWGQLFDLSLQDVTGDGAPDLLVCNDQGAEVAGNALLVNDGAGSLAAPGDELGLDGVLNCMGAAWGDLDADGALDLLIGDTAETVLLVQEAGTFVDVGAARGLTVLDSGQMAWGGALVDADNDGLTDIVEATSWFWTSEALAWPLYLLRQQHDGALADEGALPAALGARSVVAADWTGDGVVDFLVGDMWETPHRFESTGCTEGAWLEVEGPPGSVVRVEAGGVTRAAVVSHDASYASTGPAVAHVGLGADDLIDAVTLAVPWSGTVRLVGPLEPRRRLTWTAP